MTSKTRPRTEDASSPNSKRLCALQEQEQETDDAPPPLVYVHLKDASLPSSILALPHITKYLNTLLMSQDEAAIEAASTGDLEWMKKLLHRFDVEDEDMYAIAAAAVANGHLDMVKLVMKLFFDYGRVFQGCQLKTLSNLGRVAAERGHVDIVDFLIPEYRDMNSDYHLVELDGAIHEVLEAAAASGQLDVVKFLVGRTHSAGEDGNALTVAIAERQTDVALFLMEVKTFDWNFVSACETALATHQDGLVELIYEAYVPLKPNWELLVKVAQSGNLNTVKYLYESGHNDGALVSLAFEVAAEFGRTQIVTFLLATGHISSNVFDRVVELIAASNWTYTHSTLTYLVKLKRASPVTVTKVFKSVARAGNMALVKFLYENEDIAEETVVDVFLSSESFSNDHQTLFVTSFYSLPCISSEIIGRVFLSATRKGNQCVAKMLGHDTRLSIEAFGEGFIEAAQQGDVTLIKAWYKDNVISNVVMLEAFTKAAAARNTTTSIQLAKYVSIRRNMSEDLLQKLLLVAAEHGKKRALEILTSAKRGDWPLIILENALAAASAANVKNCIRQTICEQLFSGRPQEVRASDACGNAINQLIWKVV